VYKRQILHWRFRDSWFSVRDARDGRHLLTGTAGGRIIDMHALQDGFVLVVMRDNKSYLEVRRGDGTLASDTALGLDGVESLSVHALPNDDLIVGGRPGGALIKAGSLDIVRFDVEMDQFHTVRYEGGLITLVGSRDDVHSTTTITAAGRRVSHDEFVRQGQAADRVMWSGRQIGDMLVRAVERRNGKTGIAGWKADGAEAFWLPTREEDRRVYGGLVPYGRYAVAFCDDRDGLLRAQVVDPQAGKMVVESILAMTLARRVPPQVAGGNILLGTTRGLAAVTPVAALADPLPGRALSDALAPVWPMTAPLVLDGRLDEWKDQAGWRLQPSESLRGPGRATTAGRLSGWVSWRDDALVVALDIPLTPDQAGITIMAIDPVRGDYDPSDLPLLLVLGWNGGAPTVRLASRLVDDDPARPTIQARAVGHGTSLTWEVLVPWAWMYPGNERPGRDRLLRWGVAVRAAQSSSGLELASGLFDGLDTSALSRLRLVDARPASGER
jgi:hypothetical protein